MSTGIPPLTLLMWGHKNKTILLMNVSSSKIGHDFSNKVVQKLTLEKNVFNKEWSPKLIFSNEIKNSVDF